MEDQQIESYYNLTEETPKKPATKRKSKEAQGPEKIDFSQEWCRVFLKGYEHYLQNGKVYDRSTKEMIWSPGDAP